jgi:hypothetical protein
LIIKSIFEQQVVCGKSTGANMMFFEERINVYFNEATGGRYVPRAVLMDLEPGLMGETMRVLGWSRLMRLFVH